MNFSFRFWPPFGSHFGGVLGAQMEAKVIKKPCQKTSKTWCPKLPQTGPKGSPKMEAKSSKMKSWKHLVSRVAPKWRPEPLQARFWRGFGTILGPCSSIFLTYVWWFLHAFCNSMLQTKTFKITRNHQKNAAESFKETASLFVQSCIEKFTSARQRAFRSLLVQVQIGQMSAAETGCMSAVCCWNRTTTCS